jgi:hypothetical protein
MVKYFDYFYDDDDFLPTSVTPFRGIVSFFLGWFYLLVVALACSYNETLGWILFLIFLAPIMMHILLGVLNLVFFDARDAFFVVYKFFQK